MNDNEIPLYNISLPIHKMRIGETLQVRPEALILDPNRKPHLNTNIHGSLEAFRSYPNETETPQLVALYSQSDFILVSKVEDGYIVDLTHLFKNDEVNNKKKPIIWKIPSDEEFKYVSDIIGEFLYEIKPQYFIVKESAPDMFEENLPFWETPSNKKSTPVEEEYGINDLLQSLTKETKKNKLPDNDSTNGDSSFSLF